MTSLSLLTFMHWRRKWQPTPVFLPGESQGWGSLVAAAYGVTQSRTRLTRLSSSSRTTEHQASLSFTNPQSLPKLMSIESVMPFNHLFLCRPFSYCLQSFPASGSFLKSWLFTSGGVKYWTFRFSISASKEYSGLTFLRIDWFDFFAVQETLKSLLQHHSSKASILQNSAFFIVQLSHLYMTTGKTVTLTIQTFVGRVMSLFLIMSLIYTDV